MRGCLTTIVFLLITSGLSTFMLGSAFFIAVLLDPDAPVYLNCSGIPM